MSKEQKLIAAAKALCAHESEVCGVDNDDHWKLYGEDFLRSADIALQAFDALEAKAAPVGEREAAIEAAYAAVADRGWTSVKDMGIQMFQAGAAYQRAQQPQSAEAVAWMITYEDDDSLYCITQDKVRADICDGMAYNVLPLYTTPQPSAGVVVPHSLLIRVLEPITSEGYINAKHELVALMDEFARLNGKELERRVPDDSEASWQYLLDSAPSARAAGTAAARDLLAERQRQISAEGWTPEHDDEHGCGQLAGAAACYALSASGVPFELWQAFWPWDGALLKTCESRRSLVKAGALILAEIERLDRLNGKEVGRG